MRTVTAAVAIAIAALGSTPAAEAQIVERLQKSLRKAVWQIQAEAMPMAAVAPDDRLIRLWGPTGACGCVISERTITECRIRFQKRGYRLVGDSEAGALRHRDRRATAGHAIEDRILQEAIEATGRIVHDVIQPAEQAIEAATAADRSTANESETQVKAANARQRPRRDTGW